MQIALKEAYETRYWIRLIVRTKHGSATDFQHVRNEIDTIIGILVKILKSAKQA